MWISYSSDGLAAFSSQIHAGPDRAPVGQFSTFAVPLFITCKGADILSLVLDCEVERTGSGIPRWSIGEHVPVLAPEVKGEWSILKNRTT